MRCVPFNATLIRPLPFERPDRLIAIHESNPRRGLPVTSVSPANFIDWQRQSTTVSAIAGMRSVSFNFTGNTGAVRLDGAAISANLLSLLGRPLLMGRGFQEAEEQPGHDDVILISETLWQRQFGGDRQVLGKVVTMNGQRFTIVGVLPASFQFPFSGLEVWKPLAFTHAELANRSNYQLQVVARLKDGFSMEQARADLQAICSRLEHDYPDTNTGVGARIEDLHESYVGGSRNLILVMVLLIACVNIASLLSVRFLGRQHEMSLRSSLGATRYRLLRQFLTESVVLGLTGGTLGVFTALAGLRLLLHYLPISPANKVTIDGNVLLFTMLLSILCGMLFGAVPAWQSAHANPVDRLREGGRGGQGTRGQQIFQTGLIVGEIALSLVSLAGAGLLMRSFVNMLKIDPGFRSERVLVNTLLVLPRYKYPENYERVRFFRELLDRVSGLPGVEASGGITSIPLQGNSFFSPFRIQGRPTGSDGKLMAAVMNVVTPGYFSTMSIPLRGGRWFTDDDAEQSPRVALINDVAAKKFFDKSDPIGQQIFVQAQGGEPYTIVGVVGSSRQFDITSEPDPEIFTNYQQSEMSYMYVLVRTKGDPTALAPAIRHAVAEIDPDQPVGHRTLVQQLDNAVSGSRSYTLLVGVFAGLALLLASVGVYGVTSYAVSQRTREIGVRMALGAHRNDVLRLFLGRSFKIVAGGVAAGLVLALAINRVVANLLFDVKTTDAITFVSAALLLGAATVVASYVPARKATRVDPLVALRHE
jgi:putative ABC transport system permease protein